MEEIKFDDDIVIQFINTFREIITTEVRSYINSQNIETFMDLSVISVSENGFTASLKDLTTQDIYENVENHTGVMLHTGDIVRMYQGNGYSYIGLTFGNRTKSLYQNDKEDKEQ